MVAESFSGFSAYANAKLLNVIFAQELQRRVDNSNKYKGKVSFMGGLITAINTRSVSAGVYKICKTVKILKQGLPLAVSSSLSSDPLLLSTPRDHRH